MIKASTLDDRHYLPRHVSKMMEEADVKAVSMYNNHSLITVQRSKGRFKFHHRLLVEYPLKFHGEVHLIGEPIEICQLKLSARDDSQVRAVQQGNDVSIFVVHINGKLEVIRFKASDDTSLSPRSGHGLVPGLHIVDNSLHDKGAVG